MKVLVTTRVLATGSTSEGTCTVKFCNLVARRGHEVICLNGDDSLPSGPLSWLPDCTIVALPGEATSPARAPRWPLLDQKVDAARSYATGFPRALHRARRRWRNGLTQAIADHRPDAIFVRAAGQDFSPHLAMTDVAERHQGGGLAWVAHYHDPWPLSLYPDPYARRQGSIPWFQERANRRILRSAGALTFPSARLRDWESGRSGVDLGDRAVVVAHEGVADQHWEPLGTADGPLTLVHAGTLNRQRDPQPLLDALTRRLRSGASRGGAPDITLRLVGSLDPKLTGTTRWAESVAYLQSRRALELDGQRVSYAEAISVMRRADVGVVVAVGRPESPFFPAKLADLVTLGGPLLVLAPSASTPADIIGLDHPGFVDIDQPDQPDQLDRALDALVAARRGGTLARFGPPSNAIAAVAPDHIGAAIDDALARARHSVSTGSRR